MIHTFLIVVTGFAVGLLLATLLGTLWRERWVGSIGPFPGATLGAASIPPFRVSLARAAAPEWADPAAMDRVLRGFTAAGYSSCGVFEIPEMDGLRLQSFFHRGLGSFGVLFDPRQAGPLVELTREHQDGTTRTVSNRPDSGMDRPEHALSVWLEVDVTSLHGVGVMHERLADESAGREGKRVRVGDFAENFVEAYTREMDWRIARDGVTADEVRRVAAIGGQPEPDDSAVKRVQSIWRGAIDDFIQDGVQRSWFAQGGLTAAEWEELRDCIEVVHEHAAADDHIEALARLKIEGSFSEDDRQAEARTLEEARAQLAPLFEDGVRVGFALAQLALPEKRRYKLLVSLESPWPADVYGRPEDAEPV